MIKLDKKDRAILLQLDIDARQSNSQIAKKVGLNKNVVNYRIKRLMQTGIIEGFYTEIDAYRLGYRLYRIFLRLQNTTEEKEKEIIEYLIKQKRVGWLASVQGPWDLIMIVWAKKIREFYEFQNKLIEKYSDFIENKWISQYTRINNFRRCYISNVKEDIFDTSIIGNEDEIKIDDKDCRVLWSIVQDARKEINTIAKEGGITNKTAISKIKRLKKLGLIQGFRPMLNIEKLGYLYFKVHFTLRHVTKERIKELMMFAKLNPNVACVNETIGGADFEPEFQVKDNKHFRELLSQFRNRFVNIIRDYDSLLYYKEHKTFVYLPKL